MLDYLNVSTSHAFISHLNTERLDATDAHNCAFHHHKLACSYKHATTLTHSGNCK